MEKSRAQTKRFIESLSQTPGAVSDLLKEIGLPTNERINLIGDLRQSLIQVDDIEKHLKMVNLVFGDDAITVSGYRDYLSRTAGQPFSTTEEVQRTVQAVNYWRDVFGVTLSFEGRPCTLRRNSARNNFQLRLSGTQKGIYHRRAFPKLELIVKS